jgi:hypothetical protein
VCGAGCCVCRVCCVCVLCVRVVCGRCVWAATQPLLQVKDPNAPKRAISSFFFFMSEMRPVMPSTRTRLPTFATFRDECHIFVTFTTYGGSHDVCPHAPGNVLPIGTPQLRGCFRWVC